MNRCRQLIWRTRSTMSCARTMWACASRPSGLCSRSPAPGPSASAAALAPGDGPSGLRMCRHAVAMRMRLLLLLVTALLVAPKGVHLLLYRSALRWRAWKALPALVLVPGTPGHLHLRQSLCRAPQS